jgi:hypothetical protein
MNKILIFLKIVLNNNDGLMFLFKIEWTKIMQFGSPGKLSIFFSEGGLRDNLILLRKLKVPKAQFSIKNAYQFNQPIIWPEKHTKFYQNREDI